MLFTDAVGDRVLDTGVCDHQEGSFSGSEIQSQLQWFKAFESKPIRKVIQRLQTFGYLENYRSSPEMFSKFY